jgi:hypothetical protein
MKNEQIKQRNFVAKSLVTILASSGGTGIYLKPLKSLRNQDKIKLKLHINENK